MVSKSIGGPVALENSGSSEKHQVWVGLSYAQMPVFWKSSLATQVCRGIREPPSIPAYSHLSTRLASPWVTGLDHSEFSHATSWLRYLHRTQSPHDRSCPFSGASKVVTPPPSSFLPVVLWLCVLEDSGLSSFHTFAYAVCSAWNTLSPCSQAASLVIVKT